MKSKRLNQKSGYKTGGETGPGKGSKSGGETSLSARYSPAQKAKEMAENKKEELRKRVQAGIKDAKPMGMAPKPKKKGGVVSSGYGSGKMASMRKMGLGKKAK